VTTASGSALGYDALLIALGARPVEAVPGALTFGGEEERRRFAGLLAALGRRGTERLAFVVPRAAAWSIAAYELALLTAAERDARRLEFVEIALVTHEAAPLDLFGPTASRLVLSRLEDAGISLRPSSSAKRFDGHRLLFEKGDSLEADAAVALPALEVPSLPGLPQRRNGFVHTDSMMRVVGANGIWAAGDATWFPIKQGGLAAQQADVAARSIAVHAGVRVPNEPFDPVLRAALITGHTPDFLRTSVADRAAATAAGQPLWWPAGKVAGRYLAPYVAGAFGQEHWDELVDVEPSEDPAGDEAEHGRAVSLVLAAADADADIGDFGGAIEWLSLVEQLNLVIPSEYVARRYEWRRQLHSDLKPDEAAARIDPSFASPAAAISDLQRRVGWLRAIERRTEGEMRAHLTELDEGMDQLVTLCRRSGVLSGSGFPRGDTEEG
jgi:sulfide:quinone oxidoreductase